MEVPPARLAEFAAFWAAAAAAPLAARNRILASICPQIFGLAAVKLAVALTLIGGVPRQDATGVPGGG